MRKLSPKAQEAIRQRAVKAVLTGKSRSEVARLFSVSRVSVNAWVTQHRIQGQSGLKSKKRGSHATGSLAPFQAATIARLVEKHPPEALKLPFVLWTREAVQQLIERQFSIKVSIWTVGRYLKQWNFTPQKPLRRAYEQNKQAVEKWLKEDYPEILRRAKKEKAQIYWEDEMGIRSDHQTGVSYGKRGKTPIIPKTGKRFGFNMISAINNRGKLAFSLFEGSFDTKVCIGFLRRLIRYSKGKVFLIWDGHPVHKGNAMKRWLENHQEEIEVFILPGYSPELNPDELLNQDVKSNAVGRKNARTKAELKKNVKSYLAGIQRQPLRVANFFRESHVQYASAI